MTSEINYYAGYPVFKRRRLILWKPSQQLTRLPCVLDSKAVKSLWLISAELIVNNLDFVDSLQGLPDVVLEQLFNLAISQNQINCVNLSQNDRFRLFASACPGLLLRSATFLHVFKEKTDDENSVDLLLCSIFKLLSLFANSLSKLDLSYCKFGSEANSTHLSTLAGLNQLKVLRLKYCRLNEKCLRFLSAPIRMPSANRKALFNLESIDLTGNDQLSSSPKIANYLFKFPKLSLLNLTGCCFKRVDLERFADFGFKTASDGAKLHSSFDIEMEGVAASVVGEWLQSGCRSQLQPALPFYRKSKATNAAGAHQFDSAFIFLVRNSHQFFNNHSPPQNSTHNGVVSVTFMGKGDASEHRRQLLNLYS